MEPKHVIVMALEAVLESKREDTRLMKELLMADRAEHEERQREFSMLMRKKQQLLANEAAIEDLVEYFMVFIEATENNDLETAQNFDEKTMMNVFATMLNTYTGDNDNGGFSGDYEDALFDEGFSDNAGGTAVDSGGINIQPENAQTQSSDHEQDDATVASDEIDSDASDSGGESDSFCDSYRRKKL